MTGLRIGSLCSGYGGLDRAVENFFTARTVWFSEFDAAPSKILAHHWPGVPNLGDMTKIDWASVPDVDIICGGTPCQDLSAAGRRKGMSEGTRSNLWVEMREAIAVKRPALVVWENVRGAYSATADCGLESCEGCVGDSGDGGPFLRALGRVLGDLSELGYDTEWVGLRASDAGAPHARFRVFVIAYDPSQRLERFGSAWDGRPRSEDSDRGLTDALSLLRTPAAAEAEGGARNPDRPNATMRLSDQIHEALFPTPRASGGEKGGPNQRGSKGDLTMNSAVQLLPTPVASEGTKATNLQGVEQRSKTGQVFLTNVAHDLVRPEALLPTPTATYGGGTAEAHLARKNASGGNREAVTGLNFIAEESLPKLDAVAEYEALWDALDDQSPFWVTDKGVDYWPAINRWAHVMGRKAPSPTIPDGKLGKHRLNPKFTEWMMGQTLGWITAAVIGLTRNEQLKACGNGVVTQQCELALSVAWPRVLEMLAAA